MKKKVIFSVVMLVIMIGFVYFVQFWLARLGMSIAVIIVLLEIFLKFPHQLLVRLWKFGRREMGIISLRRQHSKNPEKFLSLNIDNVDFNPKAYLQKEQDYLEISLSITSSLLTDFPLCRILGTISISGSAPPEGFEIYDNLVIRKAGEKNEWNAIIVKLSKDAQEFLHRIRADEQDVTIKVSFHGYVKGERKITKEAFSGKIRVPKLPLS